MPSFKNTALIFLILNSNFLYLEQLFKVRSNSSGLRTKKSEKSN